MIVVAAAGRSAPGHMRLARYAPAPTPRPSAPRRRDPPISPQRNIQRRGSMPTANTIIDNPSQHMSTNQTKTSQPCAHIRKYPTDTNHSSQTYARCVKNKTTKLFSKSQTETSKVVIAFLEHYKSPFHDFKLIPKVLIAFFKHLKSLFTIFNKYRKSLFNSFK